MVIGTSRMTLASARDSRSCFAIVFLFHRYASPFLNSPSPSANLLPLRDSALIPFFKSLNLPGSLGLGIGNICPPDSCPLEFIRGSTPPALGIEIAGGSVNMPPGCSSADLV